MRRREFLTLGAGVGSLGLIAGCGAIDDIAKGVDDAAKGADDAAGGAARGADDVAEEAAATQTETSTNFEEETFEDIEVSTSDSTTINPIFNLEFVSHEWYRDGNTIGVKGLVQNTANFEIDFVRVQAVFLTENDVQLESNRDSTSDLAGGRSWQFKIPYPARNTERVGGYEIEIEV
jgi:hypothetical protein